MQRPHHLIPKVRSLSYFGDELEGPRGIPHLLREEGAGPHSRERLPDAEAGARYSSSVGRFPTEE